MANRRLLPRARKPEDSKSWFRIMNSAGGATVQIYNEIGFGGTTAQAFTDQLGNLDAEQITVRLNSPGGEVFDGIAIHNALKNHPAHVHVIVDGLAASIASVIAQAGDRVTMAKGSQMMIHDGHMVGVGNAKDMRRYADLLDKTSNQLASLYSQRTGHPPEHWRERMLAETWYSDVEAVKAGLADEVAAPSRQLRASWDLSCFNYAGRLAAPAPVFAHADDEDVDEHEHDDEQGDDTPPVPAVEPRLVPADETPDVWAQLTGPLFAESTRDPVLAALREAL